MKKLIYIVAFVLPVGLFAQENGKSSHTPEPNVVTTGNSNKKTVDPNKRKAIVFTEMPERVIIDSTGKEVRISLEQPSTVPPKND